MKALPLILVSLVFSSCIKKTSQVKAVGEADEAAKAAIEQGEEVLIPLIFQEKKWLKNGMIISCLYEWKVQIKKDEAGKFAIGEPQGNIQLLNDNAVAFGNLVISNLTRTLEVANRMAKDPNSKNEFGGRMLEFGGAILEKFLEPKSQTASKVDSSAPTSSPSSTAANQEKDPSRSEQDSGEESVFQTLKGAAFDQIKSGLSHSQEINSLIMSIQTDGLDPGELKGFASPAAYAVFKTLIEQAGKDSKYEACDKKSQEKPLQ